MRADKIVNVLGTAGALIVLIGVAVAATEALGAEVDPSADASIAVEISESALSAAARANMEAAADSATAVELGNKLDLDIELIDRKSFVLSGGL